MATSVPAEPIWPADAPPAEQALWAWAVGQLPDRVQVAPGIRLTDVSAGQADAEVDLVLVDPDWGVLVVEVKGGTVTYDDTHHRWWRWHGGGRRHEIRDPVAQAQRAAAFVRRALGQHLVDAAPVPVGWAVAVPECRLEAPGGAYLPAGKLWDALAADQLERLFAAACHAPGPGEEPPGAQSATRIMQILRGRAVAGRPSLAAQVAVHEHRVLAHTESHRDALYAFAHHDRVLVRGAAGTGKTALAVHAAAGQAAMGKRTLLACWNAVLGEWLRRSLHQRLAAMGSPVAGEVTDALAGRVVAGHLAGLVAEAAPDLLEDEAPSNTVFHERMPSRLEPALTGGPFDAIVLDEAQDLTDLWVIALGGLLADGGRLYAFAHAEQDLFDARPRLRELCEHSHVLRESFRSTRQIASAAAALLEPAGGQVAEVECVAGDGPAVRYVAASTQQVVDVARASARQLIRTDRLTDADVALLHLFTNPHRGEPATVAEANAAGQLVETNCATYKGMERPVVVLCLDLDPDKADRAAEAARTAYVGATRARSVLTIVGDPEVAAAYGFTTTARHLRTATSAPGR